MFEQAINGLRNLNLIGNDDIAVACYAQSSAWKSSTYILAANKGGINIFKVDKKTGAYSGSCSKFVRGEIISASTPKYSNLIAVDTTSGMYAFMTGNKLKGYGQKEQIIKLRELFESSFKKGDIQESDLKSTYRQDTGNMMPVKQISRETFSLFMYVGACILVAVALYFYFFFPYDNVEGDPEFFKTVFVGILLVMATVEITMGTLIRKGIFMKNLKSKSEILNQNRRY